MTTLPSRFNPVAMWLYCCAALVFAMVVLGGLTRLTGSGLSIVRWEPVIGVLPPMNQDDWQKLFALYQETPQFQSVNRTMDLEGFRGIFWLEYLHRLIGRLVGAVFLLPLVYFYLRGAVRGRLAWILSGIFLLGGLQGLVGWIMVKSGLKDLPHVDPLLLTGHLLTALVIHALLLRVAFRVDHGEEWHPDSVPSPTSWWRGLVILLFVTIASGGLVAGLHAGLAYNTFPLMDGRWIPEGYLELSPWYRNFYEHLPTVQWDHRLLASVTLIAVGLFWSAARRWPLSGATRFGIHLLAALAVMQYGLGVATLLLLVPIGLASAHQAGAVLLLTAALFVAFRLQARPPQ